MKFSKALVVCIMCFLLVFTVANTVLGYLTGYEPDTLINCVFAFCSVEGGLLAWIKHFKTSKAKRSKKDE